MSKNLKRDESIPVEIVPNAIVTFNNSPQEYTLERIEKTNEGKERFHWLSKCKVCGVSFSSQTGRTLGGVTRTCIEHREANKKRNANLGTTPVRAESAKPAQEDNTNWASDFDRDLDNGKLKTIHVAKGGIPMDALGRIDGKPVAGETLRRYIAAENRACTGKDQNRSGDIMAEYEAKHGLYTVDNPNAVITLDNNGKVAVMMKWDAEDLREKRAKNKTVEDILG